MRKIVSAAALILITMAVSCNLDSSQGIYQKAFYDTPKDDITIQSVLGRIGSELIIYGNGDLYRYDGNQMHLVADITKYNMEGGYMPFMAADSHVYFSYIDDNDTDDNDDDYFRFFRATLSEIENGLDSSFPGSHEVTASFSNSGSSEKIVKFNGLFNYDMTKTQVLFTVASDNADASKPDELITRYGFINKADVRGSAFTINGGAEVHAASSIIGDGILRAYVDDPDYELNGQTWTETNLLYTTNIDGTKAVEHKSSDDNNSIDYSDMVFGSDGTYCITLGGELFSVSNLDDPVDQDFIAEQYYRSNNLMLTYGKNGGGYIGYIYEEGIYVRDSGEAPVLVDINDDNDFITSCWIGRNGSKYLMATQETGFWVIELAGTDYADSSVMRFDPERDGNLSEYL